MRKIGKINIGNGDIDLYVNDEITAPIAPIVPVETITNNTGSYSITKITAFAPVNNKRKFNIEAKNVKDIGYGTNPSVYYPFIGSVDGVPVDGVWVVVIRFTNGNNTTINLDGRNGSFQLTGDNTIIKEETITIVESTIPPVVDTQIPIITLINNNEYAEVGKTYIANEKFKLHLSTYSAGDGGQYYTVKKDGKVLAEFNTEDEITYPEIYNGNHPLESILPISNGVYDFYFQNRTKRNYDKNQIVGVVGTDFSNAYIQYALGGLNKTMHHNFLTPYQESSFSLYLEDKCKKDSPLGKYAISATFYENGKICLNKLITGQGYWNNNGVQTYYENNLGNESIAFNTTKIITIKKKTDPSKNISIKIEVGDQYGIGKFTVIEKNGLDIIPSQVLLTAWNISYYKIFNNCSTGYKDSSDFKEA